MTFWCVGPYLELPIEVAHRGDPGSDDCQEGGGNDGQGALDGAQAQQQSLGDPAGTCTHSLLIPSSHIRTTHVAQQPTHMYALCLLHPLQICRRHVA